MLLLLLLRSAYAHHRAGALCSEHARRPDINILWRRVAATAAAATAVAPAAAAAATVVELLELSSCCHKNEYE